MTTPDEAAPPGVQPERTSLAWQRTALALAVGSLAAGRLLEPTTGPVIWVLAAAGVLAAGALGFAGGRRAHRWAEALAGGDGLAPGGRLLAAAALGTLLLGLTGAALVLVLG